MNHPVETLVVALIAFWILVLFTSYFAMRYFNRDTALLQALIGHRRSGKASVIELVILVPLFALMVGVLQAALLVGAITMEIPVNRLISATELLVAAGWIGYLARLPRSTRHTADPPPDRDSAAAIDGRAADGHLDEG